MEYDAIRLKHFVDGGAEARQLRIDHAGELERHDRISWELGHDEGTIKANKIIWDLWRKYDSLVEATEMVVEHIQDVKFFAERDLEERDKDSRMHQYAKDMLEKFDNLKATLNALKGLG